MYLGKFIGNAKILNNNNYTTILVDTYSTLTTLLKQTECVETKIIGVCENY